MKVLNGRHSVGSMDVVCLPEPSILFLVRVGFARCTPFSKASLNLSRSCLWCGGEMCVDVWCFVNELFPLFR